MATGGCKYDEVEEFSRTHELAPGMHGGSPSPVREGHKGGTGPGGSGAGPSFKAPSRGQSEGHSSHGSKKKAKKHSEL